MKHLLERYHMSIYTKKRIYPGDKGQDHISGFTNELKSENYHSKVVNYKVDVLAVFLSILHPPGSHKVDSLWLSSDSNK